jgi:hypothetical protein
VASAAVSGRLGRSGGEFLCVLLLLVAAAVGAPAAAEEEEDDEAADAGAEADDEAEMAVDPGFDLSADGPVLTLSLCCVRLQFWVKEEGSGLRFGRFRRRYIPYRRGSFVANRSIRLVRTWDSRS